MPIETHIDEARNEWAAMLDANQVHLAERELAHAETLKFLDQHQRDFPDFDTLPMRAAHERRIQSQRDELAAQYEEFVEATGGGTRQ
jgi:hypothetical protein